MRTKYLLRPRRGRDWLRKPILRQTQAGVLKPPARGWLAGALRDFEQDVRRALRLRRQGLLDAEAVDPPRCVEHVRHREGHTARSAIGGRCYSLVGGTTRSCPARGGGGQRSLLARTDGLTDLEAFKQPHKGGIRRPSSRVAPRAETATGGDGGWGRWRWRKEAAL